MEVSDALAGADLIRAGLRDIRDGGDSIEALLVLVAENSDAAHSRDSALIRKLVSLERTAECVKP